MDGNGALFGTLSGNTREILQRLSVDLPKKHVSLSHLLLGFISPAVSFFPSS
jgi:hypothetical protein